MDNPVVAKWNELKATLDSIEPDLAKNSRGVAAAGVRARKGLRVLKEKVQELIKLTIEFEKKKETTPVPDNA